MRENRLRTIWQDGGVAINGWLHIPSSYSAEVMAHRGWDSLVLDMQHGPIDAVNALAMLQAISTTPTVPLVRVPWNEPSVIMRMLDAVFVGPSDLGQSLGMPPRMDTTEPRTVEAIDLVLERARHHDVVAGIFTVDPEYAAAMIDKGFQFVSVASDARLAASAADAVIGRLRAGRESAPAARGY